MSEKVELSRQQQKSKETKEKIFQAAKRILQKKGYEELSIKNICEEAGVSNGSFYHHFRTKDDLLSYYIEDQPTINPDLLELPGNADGVREGIIQVYLNYVKYCRELGVEFMSGYYDTKNQALKCGNPDRAALPDCDGADLCGKGHCRRNCPAECEDRGIYNGYPYDCDWKCV